MYKPSVLSQCDVISIAQSHLYIIYIYICNIYILYIMYVNYICHKSTFEGDYMLLYVQACLIVMCSVCEFVTTTITAVAGVTTTTMLLILLLSYCQY